MFLTLRNTGGPRVTTEIRFYDGVVARILKEVGTHLDILHKHRSLTNADAVRAYTS